MGQHKENQIVQEEAITRRMKRDGLICGICGQPASETHPKWGRVCSMHAEKIDRPISN